MKVIANGKNIRTHAFGELFVQGEKMADTIEFVIDRFYNGTDLGLCTFCIRGLTKEGYELEQALLPMVTDDEIELCWRVSDSFTIESGRLCLELRASRTDSLSGEDMLVVKYHMPPVNVAPTVAGPNGPVPETAEQAVSQINNAVSEGLSALRAEEESFDIDTVRARLDAMETAIAVFLARPEVIPVTAEDYAALVHKDNSLYVIIEEAE